MLCFTYLHKHSVKKTSYLERQIWMFKERLEQIVC